MVYPTISKLTAKNNLIIFWLQTKRKKTTTKREKDTVSERKFLHQPQG